MPADLGIVVARTFSPADLVAFIQVLVGPPVVAHVNRIIYDLDQQRVVSRAGNGRAVELEWREHSFVRAQELAIDEDVRYIVNSLEADKQRAHSAHRLGDFKGRAVVGSGPPEWPPIVRDAHAFPVAVAGQLLALNLILGAREVRQIVVGRRSPIKRGQSQPISRILERWREHAKKLRMMSSLPRQFAPQLLGRIDHRAWMKRGGGIGRIRREDTLRQYWWPRLD